MSLDSEVCYRALRTRDARFDGRIFVAVRTTGIYCRPICPARTPKRENVEFHPSAASAQAAGFRPCLRCRPESSPEVGAWRGTSATVARALALIGEGALDGDTADVAALASRLGIGERQLRRLFVRHLGASPVAVAQTRRVLFAKKLIHETRMSMTAVATAAGFGSLRRFHATFHALYGRPPSALRWRSPVGGAAAAAPITLQLGYVPPYDWDAIVAFLAARAIAGVEVVEPRRYRRTIGLDGAAGTLEVAPIVGRDALAVTIRFPDVHALPAIVARVRRIFDLGVDVAAVNAELAADPLLARLVAARPGLRVPGAWDGFELAVRAVLGQQITVRAAPGLAGRLVGLYGAPSCAAAGDLDAGLTTVFPSPERLAHAKLASLGMPRARAATLAALARAAAADPRLFDRGRDLDAALARLRALPGIGDWTAQYVAMRAMREPDAFPASDVGLLRALALDGVRPTPLALAARAERWRPWRAYAAQHLWTIDAAAGSGVGAREEAVA